MKKQKIIFYQTRADIEGLDGTVMNGEMTKEEREKVLEDFNLKKIKTLLVPLFLSSGWRTGFTSKECAILFMGEWCQLKPEYINQANARVMRLKKNEVQDI